MTLCILWMICLKSKWNCVTPLPKNILVVPQQNETKIQILSQGYRTLFGASGPFPLPQFSSTLTLLQPHRPPLFFLHSGCVPLLFPHLNTLFQPMSNCRLLKRHFPDLPWSPIPWVGHPSHCLYILLYLTPITNFNYVFPHGWWALWWTCCFCHHRIVSTELEMVLKIMIERKKHLSCHCAKYQC